MTLGGQRRHRPDARRRGRRARAGLRLCRQHGKGRGLRSGDRRTDRALMDAGRHHHRLRHGRGDARRRAGPHRAGAIADPGTRRAAEGQPRGARPGGDLRARPLPPEGDMARRRRPPFNPGNYAFVGGNTKFYGAVLLRYRAEDFRPLAPHGRHDARLADRLRRSGAALSRRPNSCTACGARSRARPDRAARIPAPIPSRRCRTNPTSRPLRQAFAAQGLHPSSLPLGVDIDALAGPRADDLGRLPRHAPGPSPTPKAAGWPRR